MSSSSNNLSSNNSQNVKTLFIDVYQLVLKNVTSKTLNVTDIVPLAKSAMEIVESFSQLDGPSKKQMVIDVLSEIISQSGLVSPDQVGTALEFVSNQLPTIIDLVVAATKNEVKINSQEHQTTDVQQNVRQDKCCNIF